MIPPKPPRNVIVCGGRNYADRDRVYEVLDVIHANLPIDFIVHGCALGADKLANDWAREHGVDRLEYPADWRIHGRGAGPIRNQLMADAGAALCVAFPGGRGTADMVRRATAAGIPVQVVP